MKISDAQKGILENLARGEHFEGSLRSRTTVSGAKYRSLQACIRKGLVETTGPYPGDVKITEKGQAALSRTGGKS